MLLSAKASAAENPRFFIRHWDTADGLPQHSVISMMQTRDGYLWLGTLDGLARFDGAQFDKFYDANTPGLNSTRILRLFEDSHNNFWIGTENAGIVLVDQTGVLKRVDLGKETAGAQLASISEDPTGGIWLRLVNGSVYSWRNGKATLLLRGAREIIVEGSNKVWVATQGSSEPAKLLGLRLAEGGFQTVAAVEDEFPINAVQWLMSSPRGGYWLIANGRVNKYKGNQLTGSWGMAPLGAALGINAACEDGAGNIILGTAGEGIFWFRFGGGGVQIASQGIFLFNTNGVIDPKAVERSELTHDSILSLCLDREGDLWAGTDGGGLNRIKPAIFDAVEEGQTVTSVCENSDGGLWMASGGALVLLKDGSRKSFGMRDQLWSSISIVYQDREKNVWAGGKAMATNADGRRFALGPLFSLKGSSLQPVPLRVSGLTSAIFQDRSGRLWVGTDAGLACQTQGQWTLYTTRDGLPANAVHALAEDSSGHVWIGSEGGGLTRFKDGHFNVMPQTNGLPGNTVSSLYVDKDDVLWAGTTGGLMRFYHGQWTCYSKKEGLINEHVVFILEDGDGYLWLGSTAGLTRALKEQLNDFALTHTNEVFFRLYGAADGLPSAECFLGSQPAACRTQDGTLWFSTIKGAATVNPSLLQRNTNPPPVIIKSVFVDGDLQITNAMRAAPPGKIIIPAKKESLEIHFTSLNLSAPLEGKFRYRMENHEKEWTEKPGSVRFARYPKLPAGNYQFQVKAYNEDNVESRNMAVLAIEVLPPFWQTWWFRITLTLVALGLVAGVVYYLSTQRLQGQLAAMRQQEALERERARIARDLHDQLGANLTQVALLGELAETDKNFPEEVEAHARQISQTARETTHALDEIVWTVNPSNDTLDGLINYVCKYAQEYLALAGLRYRLDVPSQLPNTPISPELRHNVFLAAKETVNNIVKHSGAQSAWLRLQLQPDGFVLEIEDDGKGLSPDAENKGRSGLKNMRKRMEDVGGQFEIGPRQGGGTVVRLQVKLNHS